MIRGRGKDMGCVTRGLAWALAWSFVLTSVARAGLSPELKNRVSSGATGEIPVIVVYKKNSRAVAAPGALKRQTASAQLRQRAPSLDARTEGVNLWVVHGSALRLTRDKLTTLSQDPQVDTIVEDVTLYTPQTTATNQASALPGIPWGLGKIGAPETWNSFGVTGRGVRIGHLDTGVDSHHPALAEKILDWAEFGTGGQRVANSTPHDSGTHGTHTAGILVGGTPSQDPVGVAPGAKLLSALILNGQSGTLSQALAGLQWVLDPDDNPATDDGAQIVSMSFGLSGENTFFQNLMTEMIAVGVLPVAAIGNDGPGTTNSPGNAKGVLGVGATGPSDSVSSFSGGAALPEGNGSVRLKPDLVAPGSNIVSAIPGGTYLAMSGTSMAAPHVAGAAAVIKELRPDFSATQLQEALLKSADKCPLSAESTRSGQGRLNLWAAASAVAQVSMVRGRVTQSAGPVAAVITICRTANQDITQVTANPSTGLYQWPVSPGEYEVSASFGSNRTQTRHITVSQASAVTVDFSLETAGDGVDNLWVYPNPARPGSDRVIFDGLPQGSRVQIFSTAGDWVQTVEAGAGRALWDGANADHILVSDGLYFYVATAPGSSARKKGRLVMLR